MSRYPNFLCFVDLSYEAANWWPAYQPCRVLLAPDGLLKYIQSLPLLGSLSCSADSLIAGEWTELIVTYTVGRSSLADGAWMKGLSNSTLYLKVGDAVIGNPHKPQPEFSFRGNDTCGSRREWPVYWHQRMCRFIRFCRVSSWCTPPSKCKRKFCS